MAWESSFQPRFDHNKGLCPRVIVGQCYVNDRLVAGRGHFVQPVARPAGHLHHGLAGMQVRHRHVAPRDAHAQTGPQRLGAGFFRGPAFGVGAGGVAAAFGLGLFNGREDAVAEPVAETVERVLDAVDIRKVGANAQDHRVTPPRTAES